jgi:hypothetical protein
MYSDTNTVLLLDAENAIYPLRQVGLELDFKRYFEELTHEFGEVFEAHAVGRVKPQCLVESIDFALSNEMIPHFDLVRRKLCDDGSGRKVHGNSDDDIVSLAEKLARELRPRTMLLFTGDYELICNVIHVVDLNTTSLHIRAASNAMSNKAIHDRRLSSVQFFPQHLIRSF